MSDSDHRQLHLAVRQVVNELDPEGLIAFEAPEDEYDPEVRDLVRVVLSGKPVTDEAVSTIWAAWFGLDAGDLDERSEILQHLAQRLRDLAAIR